MNDNQNYFVQQGRSTSRVLAPPGGHSSISFGTTEAAPVPAPVKKKVDPKPVEKVETKKKEEEETKDAPAATTSTATKKKEEANKPVSNNVFARDGGGNVITGRPSSRVLQPPGGHCSIRLG
mmetsp:Transcript_14895/g.21061  ORF Transcript_14895/g.21061 Transcript_14895/m.21061 type:complete len:122 (+) Transcript_14895:96-461(+)